MDKIFWEGVRGVGSGAVFVRCAAWVQKTGDQAKADALLRRLDAALKSNNVTEGEKIADEILELFPAK
jgi:hypothetical protein